jgi:hypothetical protein
MKKTAVDWLIEQLIEHRIIIVDKTTYQVKYKHQIILEQAKEMEKQQIIRAFDEGQEYEYQYHINIALNVYSETYYNKKYKVQEIENNSI